MALNLNHSDKIFSNPPTPLVFKNPRSGFEKKLAIRAVVDHYREQLEELFYLRHPSLAEGSSEAERELNKFLNRRRAKKDDFSSSGCWVYYPWTQLLVHFLDPNEHQEIRVARNKYLLSEKEQDKFRKFSVGVAGLSIGNSVALTLAYSGGCENMKLADPDCFSASNLNRVRVPAWCVGLKKVYVAAHQIYEINPYANLKLYPEGVNEANLEDFLLSSPKLNLVVEEMDNLKMKVFIRLAARACRLPVLMTTDNGDNAIIDIDRFDRGDIPNSMDLLPKMSLADIVSDLNYGEGLDLSPIEKVKLASGLVGPDNIEPRMQKSLMEVGKTLVSWPQLGGAAFLGGAALNYLIKKIAIGEEVKAGKIKISLDDIFIIADLKRDKQRQLQTEHFRNYLSKLTSEVKKNYEVWNTKEENFPKGGIDRKIKFILNYALMAPSAHNAQPWRFKISNNKIQLLIDEKRDLGVSDPIGREIFIGLGALLANLRIAFEHFNCSIKIELSPNRKNNLVAKIEIKEEKIKIGGEDNLFKAIPKRHSDRSFYENRAIDRKVISAIKALNKDKDLQVVFMADPKTKGEIAKLVARGSEKIMKDGEFRRELAGWIRHNFTQEGDGMPGFTTNQEDIQSIVGPFLIKNYDIGHIQSGFDKKAVESSSLLLVISSPQDDPLSWLKVGQLYERIMLFTTNLGISNATMASLVEMSELRVDLKKILKIRDYPQVFFRLGYSDKPTLHSPRLSVEETLI